MKLRYIFNIQSYDDDNGPFPLLGRTVFSHGSSQQPPGSA